VNQLRVAHVATVRPTLQLMIAAQMRRLTDEGFAVTGVSAPPQSESWSVGGEDGIRYVDWPHATRAWAPISDVLAFIELLRIFRSERFDVVHTHNPKPGLIGRVAARLAGVPVIVNTVHGLYATPTDGYLKRLLVLSAERMAGRFSDLELYQSEEDLDWANRSHLVSEHKLALLGNGTDLSKYSPSAVSPARILELRAELGIPPDAVVVGTIGRLVAEKGFNELLYAARRILGAGANVSFVWVGPGDPAKPDAIESEQISSPDSPIIFTGWRQDVRDLLAMMDIFVLASWREGLPRSAVEAAAMGKPMVLTDIRGCREVVTHGLEGILVPPRNGKALHSAISRLVEDADLRARMGIAARLKALAKFDEEKVAGIVVEQYKRLLATKGLSFSSNGHVKLRKARPEDARQLARLHMECLPGSFLPQLGSRFLRLLYEAMATDEDGAIVVADQGGRVVGFISAVRSVPNFYRRFYRTHGLKALLYALPRLARWPVLKRAWETARYPARIPQKPEAELLSLALDPACRGRGTGRALVEEVLRELGNRGVSEAKGVVHVDLEAPNQMYDRMGFQIVDQLVLHDGEKSNLWRFPCHS
jgi:glycosyltransferase involved in cell wall biosynthesis/ribosomal protein S18 acetylase RimI-like enzyme